MRKRYLHPLLWLAWALLRSPVSHAQPGPPSRVPVPDTVRTLDEVTIRATRPDPTGHAPTMSRIDLSVAQLATVPTLLGERDLLRTLQLLPGVQKASEGNAGIYVRGGGPDQNLLLLDGATVYNPSHLLGFFSAFNSDALQRVELTKGGFPARYGGRLSSVIELTGKEGDPDSLRAEVSAGLLASRGLLHGPLAGGKGRFLLAARRTYLDLLTRPLTARTGSGAGASLSSYFYDLNATVSYQPDPANKLTASAFFSRDAFVNGQDAGLESGLDWQNRAASLRWFRTRPHAGLATLSLLYSQYDLTVTAQQRLAGAGVSGPVLALRYQSGIRDWGLQYDRLAHHRLGKWMAESRAGFLTTYHRFTPDATVTDTPDPDPANPARHYLDALESGLYAETTIRPGRWQVNGGLRLSHYILVGEGNTRIGGRSPANEPGPDGPAVDPADTSQASRGAGRGAVQYLRLEPRLSVTYRLRMGLLVSASVADMNQYVHLLSSTGVGLPTDLWVPTTDRLRPQRARQVAIGLARDLTRPGLTLSVEAYYKTMQGLVSYAEGAGFLSSDGPARQNAWAENLVTGRGWSAGVEVFLQKKPTPAPQITGWAERLSGWVGYTLSRTQWQFDALNGGLPFAPRYDRRHDLSVVGVYALSPTITLGGTFVYGTGNALTLPLARFSGFEDRPDPTVGTDAGAVFGQAGTGSGGNVNAFGPRNGLRAEPYHRLDLSWQFRRARRVGSRTWAIGVYNAYNRRNPFYYSLEGRAQAGGPSQTVLYRYSLFSVLPSVSYSRTF